MLSDMPDHAAGRRLGPSGNSSCAHEPTSDAIPWTATAGGAEMTTTNPERDIYPRRHAKEAQQPAVTR